MPLPYTPAADQLTPLRQAVWEADKAHRAAKTFEALNITRARYSEAVDALRDAESWLNPEECDHHHLAA